MTKHRLEWGCPAADCMHPNSLEFDIDDSEFNDGFGVSFGCPQCSRYGYIYPSTPAGHWSVKMELPVTMDVEECPIEAHAPPRADEVRLAELREAVDAIRASHASPRLADAVGWAIDRLRMVDIDCWEEYEYEAD